MASSSSPFARMLVLVASAVGILAAVVVLALSWPAPADLFMARLTDSASIVMCLLVLGIMLLVALRGGDQTPNVAIALSLTFIYGSIVVSLLLDRLQVLASTRQYVQLVLFLL